MKRDLRTSVILIGALYPLPLCIVKSSCRVIRATCPSFTRGFQVIVQLSNASEVWLLRINQSMDPHAPATVEVERDGPYLVTVFPLREGRGILDSVAERLVLGEVSTTTTTTTTNTTTTTTTATEATAKATTATTVETVDTVSSTAAALHEGKRCINTYKTH